MSQGETYEEALANIKEAMQLLEDLNESETLLLKNKVFSVVPIEIVESENVIKNPYKLLFCVQF